MRNLFFVLLCLLVMPFSAVFSDDDGVAIGPEVYAKQEAVASQRDYGHTLCNNPDYVCRSVSDRDTWYSLFPDFQQREEVMRLNRTNVALIYRSWIVEPKDFSTMSYMDMSPLPVSMKTHGRPLLFVDLKQFAFGAYDKHGKLLYWGPVSAGEKKCASGVGSCSTPVGHFKVFRKGGEDCISHEYPLETHGGAPMPYCMYFHNGAALHASTLSGFINRSAGCIRLFSADAKWLNERFVQRGTRVTVVR